MLRYLYLRSTRGYSKDNYHMLIATAGDDGKIAGGVICDSLAKPNCGVVEFLVVAFLRTTGGP
jgi:hypothetical protein